MSKMITLNNTVQYSKKRIKSEDVTLENFISTDNILQNKLGITQATNLPPNGLAMPCYSEEDILIANIRPYLKKLWFSDRKGGCSSDVLVFETKKGYFPKFIYYNLFKDDFFDFVMKGSKGTKMPRGDKNQILDFLIPDFDISTQQKIAKVLSDIDSKIELNNKINSELEAMAKTLYDYWFVQFDFPARLPSTSLRLTSDDDKPVTLSLSHRAESRCEKPSTSLRQTSDDDKPATLSLSHRAESRCEVPYKTSGGKMVWNEELKREIPEGWEVKTLLDIATFTNGLACQKFRPKENEDFYRVIKIREMGSGFTDNSEFVSRSIPERVVINNGDILFSWSATLDVKIWTGGKGALNQHIFKVTSKKYPSSYYYYELLNYLQHFKMQAELRKTTMGHITQDHLKQSRITIPPIDLIKKLDSIIHPILEKKVKLEEENQQLSSLRDWLLPMLMNGQVRVGDVEVLLQAQDDMLGSGSYREVAEPKENYGKQH